MSQEQEKIEQLSAENSSMHQEIIALRRRVAQLERTIGKMDRAVELAASPVIHVANKFDDAYWEDVVKSSVASELHFQAKCAAETVQTWHEESIGGLTVTSYSRPVEDPVSPRAVDGVGVR